MKRYFLCFSCLSLAVALAGCASWKALPGSRHGQIAYSGAKAKITVADFEIKAPKAKGDIGLGLRQMLEGELAKSDRFIVIDRKELNTDLILAVIVLGLELQASGGSQGLGGGGGVNSGILGGLLGPASGKAHITLEVRVIDAVTSRVLRISRISGQAIDAKGPVMAAGPGNLSLPKELFSFANSPTEKAIRICFNEVLRYLKESIPASYYKYK